MSTEAIRCELCEWFVPMAYHDGSLPDEMARLVSLLHVALQHPASYFDATGRDVESFVAAVSTGVPADFYEGLVQLATTTPPDMELAE